MPLFDYTCSSGHTTELLRPRSEYDAVCPACGQTAARKQVNLVSMQIGGTADWSSLVHDNGQLRAPVNERRIPLRQWDEATSELAYAHHQAEQSVGRTLPEPPLFEIAKARADALMKAGVNDSLDMPK